MNETCDYLTQPGNVPCGQPATSRYWTAKKCWFHLCPDHGIQFHKANKKVTLTPLVATILEEKKDTLPLANSQAASARLAAPARPVYQPAIPAVVAGKSLSQLFREQQEAQSEGTDLL